MREERGLDFWLPVFEAEECQPAHCGLQVNAEALGKFLQSPFVMPLAGDHGGYLFVQKDDHGMIWELHSLFKRPGWGKEAARIGKAALFRMFGEGMQLLYTYEVKGLPSPPLSYGWKPAQSDYGVSAIGPVRIWILTKTGWECSSARRSAKV